MKVKGEERWHALQIPECGIDFQRYRSDDCEVYICAWRDDSNSHVYEVRCRKVRGAEAANQDAPERWVAELSNDGRKICSLIAAGKHVAYTLGLGAMRAYLRSGHRKTLRAAEPLSPEEELAATVARQKEEAE